MKIPIKIKEERPKKERSQKPKENIEEQLRNVPSDFWDMLFKEAKKDYSFEKAEIQDIQTLCIAYLSQYKGQSQRHPNGKCAIEYKRIAAIFEKIKKMLN